MKFYGRSSRLGIPEFSIEIFESVVESLPLGLEPCGDEAYHLSRQNSVFISSIIAVQIAQAFFKSEQKILFSPRCFEQLHF